MSPTIEQVADVQALRAAVAGAVHVPGDDAYVAASGVFNVLIQQRPALVVEATRVEDVVAAVRHAVANGLQVTAQAKGHGATHDDLSNTVLVRTSGMGAITVDVAGETARVGAGVRWGDLMPVVGEYGLVGMAGSAADVGVVGYSLGGGLSWFGRRHGYSANNVVAIELVDATGEVVEVTAANDPELFWALRGGGGSFGIVTAIEIELHRAPQMYGGQVVFPVERAKAVMRAFKQATRAAGVDSSLTVSITNVPPLPDVPPVLQGRSIVNVGLVHVGDPAVAKALLWPIYEAGGEPIVDMMRPLTAAEIGYVAMDPEEPLPYELRATIVERFADEAIDEIIELATTTPVTMVQVRHLGGALGRPDARGGACGHLEGEFLVYGVGAIPVPELEAPVKASLWDLKARMAPWAKGRRPFTFTEDGDDVRDTLGDVHDRLAVVKARRDPDGVFRANHTVA